MRTLPFVMLFFCLIGATTSTQAQTSAELADLRAELAQMRADYEERITQLEQRLAVAEQKNIGQPTEPDPQTTEYRQADNTTKPVARAGNQSSNPDIGVIFQGQAWRHSGGSDDYLIPGFPLAGEAGPLPEGLSLGEIELNISGNVDDKFTAWLTVPIAVEDGEVEVELEEAWIETLALPAGLSLRVGRFFSNIGYLNDKHRHSWNFVDQPLAYQVFLGNQYLDDGAQLRWLAPTDFYLELGAEVTRGDRYPAGGAANSGFGTYTLHARSGGDIGFSHSWQAGISYLQADAQERVSGSEDSPLMFTGTTRLMMAEFVWKWAPNGNNNQRNFVFQTEYLWRNEDGFYNHSEDPILAYDTDQQGWYAQAVYQPFPRWRMGVRYDQLSSSDPGQSFIGTDLMPTERNPYRYSIMADWSNSEFSRLRLQYTFDRAGMLDDNQWGLQYTFSIGAHGAHSF